MVGRQPVIRCGRYWIFFLRIPHLALVARRPAVVIPLADALILDSQSGRGLRNEVLQIMSAHEVLLVVREFDSWLRCSYPQAHLFP